MPKKKSAPSNRPTGSTRPVKNVLSLLVKANTDGWRKSKEFTHLLEKCSPEEQKEVFEFIMGHLNMDGNRYNPDDEKPRPLIFRNIHYIQEQEKDYRDKALFVQDKIDAILAGKKRQRINIPNALNTLNAELCLLPEDYQQEIAELVVKNIRLNNKANDYLPMMKAQINLIRNYEGADLEMKREVLQDKLDTLDKRISKLEAVRDADDGEDNSYFQVLLNQLANERSEVQKELDEANENVGKSVIKPKKRKLDIHLAKQALYHHENEVRYSDGDAMKKRKVIDEDEEEEEEEEEEEQEQESFFNKYINPFASSSSKA